MSKLNIHNVFFKSDKNAYSRPGKTAYWVNIYLNMIDAPDCTSGTDFKFYKSKREAVKAIVTDDIFLTHLKTVKIWK